jgi:integrase
MICQNDGITAYCDRYLAARDLCPDYCDLVRARIDKFCRWCGADIRIGELTNELANDWLGELAEGGMNPRTLSGYRAAILCIWREAFAAGDNDHPPLRLRRIKKPALLISAFNHDELRAILDHAASLKRKHRDGNSAADFWQAAIHVGYSIGARRGDLLKLQRDQITPDGVIRFVQNKTGFAAGGRLSADALDFIRRLVSDGPALPWPYKRAAFTRAFKRLRSAAGISRGTFKWVRRSAGSYAESQRAGDGAKLLGHRCEHIFRLHYQDDMITGAEPVQPPPLT